MDGPGTVREDGEHDEQGMGAGTARPQCQPVRTDAPGTARDEDAIQ